MQTVEREKRRHEEDDEFPTCPLCTREWASQAAADSCCAYD